MDRSPSLSPLRRTLCSPIHAARLAKRMRAEGLDVVVILTGDLLQPWRVIERDACARPPVLACA